MFVCSRTYEGRERFRGGALTPEGIGRRLLSSQREWDAVIDLATEVVDRLNCIRGEEERRGRRQQASTALHEVMPNGGSRGGNYSRGEALHKISREFLVGISRNDRLLSNIFECVNAFFPTSSGKTYTHIHTYTHTHTYIQAFLLPANPLFKIRGFEYVPLSIKLHLRRDLIPWLQVPLNLVSRL